MAYRKSKGKLARRSKKIEPAVQTMLFQLPFTGGGAIDQLTIDLSQCASILNRRFYRQGINWAVAGFKVLTPDNFTGLVQIEKLPDTWVMSNAWEKGFRTWMKMNDEALEESESVKPRFLDYKIYADSDHHTAGFAANLLPGVSNPAYVAATAGEWKASEMTVPFGPSSPGNTTDFEIIAVGPSYPGAAAGSGLNAVSLIEGYAASRGLPNVLDPNTPDDARDADGSTPENWMAATFNDGTDQVSDVLTNMEDNNIAPYPFENDGVNADTMYPGGANQLSGLQFHDLELITGTTVGGTSRLKGGLFPCGLVRIQCSKTEPVASVATLIVDLVPGTHRGYMCEPMTDM